MMTMMTKMEESYNLFIRKGGLNSLFLNAMITSETPHKLAEIIRDTWPNLYRVPKVIYNEEKENQNEQVSE
jgi:hypothetical protein